MKIRSGFVSNSSSASFIVGIVATNDLDLIKKYQENYKYQFNFSQIEEAKSAYHVNYDERNNKFEHTNYYTTPSISSNNKDYNDETFIVTYRFEADSFEEGEYGEVYNSEFSDDDMQLIRDLESTSIEYDQGSFEGRDG